MKGIIFIPDISGFTNFVKSINIDLGATITINLLNEIINNNPLDLELTQIEGDALLFYKVGQPIPLKDLLAAFEKIYNAFDARYRSLKSQYKIDSNLSLKFIVHYGDIKVYNVKGFRNLFGQAVIESHSLLKNNSGKTEYILVTEAYLNALKQKASDGSSYCTYSFNCSKFLGSVKTIPFYIYQKSERQSLVLNGIMSKEPFLKDAV